MSWQHRKGAMKDLFARYQSVFGFWWSQREQLKSPELRAHELEFLPATLSLQVAPVSPAGRWVARIILGLLVIVLLWSVLGKIDIIVNGQGKVIASGRTKTIASVEIAKVTAIHVAEGDSVKAGDLLLELDARGPDSERNKADLERQLGLLQMERSKALLEAIRTNTAPVLASLEGVDVALFESEAKHVTDQWNDYVAKRNRISSQIKRYAQAHALAARRAIDYQALAKDRDVSTHAYLEKEQARVDLEGQLEDAKTQLVALTAETRKTAQDDLHQATRLWSDSTQDAKKAAARSDLLKLYTPVDGVVQQLAVHTINGVVPATQPLMLIVPDQRTVELEAYIDNKDVGFLKEGDIAHVKLDAYDFTKYGTIPAVVTHVSQDSVDFSGNGTGQLANKTSPSKAEGTKNLLYAIKVKLQQQTIAIEGRTMPILPGMSGTVEIKTGERRVIEYVLSPLIATSSESLHER
jgi:hemolysin D